MSLHKRQLNFLTILRALFKVHSPSKEWMEIYGEGKELHNFKQKEGEKSDTTSRSARRKC